MFGRTKKQWHGTGCAGWRCRASMPLIAARVIGALVILVLAPALAGADPIKVGGDPIKPPTQTIPPGQQRGVTNYQGQAGNGWKNEVPPGAVPAGQNHRYDPATKTLNMANSAFAENTKYLWVHLIFDRGAGYGGVNPVGQLVKPGKWGVASAPGNPPPQVNLTGVAWKFYMGTPSWLHMWQTWEIIPQPASEKVDLSNIVDELKKHPAAIQAQTVCVNNLPEPASLLLLAMGLPAVLGFGRRRRVAAI